MEFYAIMLVLCILEILHFESVTGSISPGTYKSNKERLIASLMGLFLPVGLFIVTITQTMPMRFPKEMDPGVYTFCIFSFILNLALLRRVLMKIEN